MWKPMEKHPLTGILCWIAYMPQPAEMPKLVLINIGRYDSWNNEFRLLKDGQAVFAIAWVACEVPNKPTQSEIDRRFV